MTPDQKEQAVTLRSQGMKYEDISSKLGCPLSTVTKYIWARDDFETIRTKAREATGYRGRYQRKTKTVKTGAFEALKAKVKAMKGAS